MPIFKDRAKKVIDHIREVRNRGTCRPANAVDDDEQGPVGSQHKMAGVVLAAEGVVDRVLKADPNNNRSSPESIIAHMKKLTLRSSLSIKRDEEEEEPPYTVPIEEALGNFNRRWNAKNSRALVRKKSDGKEVELGVKDYHLLKVVGKGAFGKVLLVQSRSTGKFYAMKVLEKRKVISTNSVGGVINEKKLLQCVSFPFIVGIHAHFKDSANLYMVMEFVSGGDLFFHLRRSHRFNEEEAQFYCGQIVLAFEYLHAMNVIYRDLKPENIMINYDGYIKLTDFGLAKRLTPGGRTNTLLGTAEYLAPEVFLEKPYGKGIDWWALGILTYEMVHGKSPFLSETDHETFHKILGGKIKFGHHSLALKNIVLQLLKDDPAVRLGVNSASEVKNHEWFENMDWQALLHKKMKAPFVPELGHRGDTRFFDTYNERFDDLCYDLAQDRDVRDDLFASF